MKRLTSLILLVFILAESAFAQDNYRHLFRLYEDNDYINFRGKGTDRGYTNGTRLDYYFIKQRPSNFFIDRWLPAAGPAAVNTFSYHLTQLMLVPNDLSRVMPDKNDWPYSGALFLTHSLHSSDPVRKFSVQTEIIAGVMGPLSLAENAQIWLHQRIHYTMPAGWDQQMPDDALVNINLYAEKMIWQTGRWAELTGGAGIQAGTMTDGASLQVQLRLGYMEPYFDSYTGRYGAVSGTSRGRLQFYFFVRPAVSLWAYNALLDGGVFDGKSDYYAGKDDSGSSPAISRITSVFEGGIVVIAGRTSLSFTQKQLSPVLKGVEGQAVGNFSFTYSW